MLSCFVFQACKYEAHISVESFLLFSQGWLIKQLKSFELSIFSVNSMFYFMRQTKAQTLYDW